VKIKTILLILILNLLSIAHGACRNYDRIARQADVVSADLNNLYFESRVAFPHSWNLLDNIRRVEMDATFLYRVTRSGSMPCWQTKSNFSNLEKSAEVLRRHFSQFSRRRDVTPITYDWRRFIDSYKRLEIYMINAREE